MPRSKEQNEARRDATRTKIHSAAIELFSQKGLSGTTVQEIADSAGISVGLLYRHYKTKDDVFVALATMAANGLEQVGDMFESDFPPLETMKGFAKEVVADICGNDEFARFMVLLSGQVRSNRHLSFATHLLERNRIFMEQLSGLIKKGQDAGVFRHGDPTGMAVLFLSMIQGLCEMKLAWGEQFTAPTADMLSAFIIKEVHNVYE